MGNPAVIMNDQITGNCPIHQVPNPGTGAPQPAPPMPFSAPLLQGLSTSVMIGGKPAALVGSSGTNTPPHIGLHVADPYMAPPMQTGRVTGGSATVLMDGKPAATSSSTCTMCATPGQVVGSATTVLIG